MATQLRSDELLQRLRRRTFWTVGELARELDVSRRTILRDLNDLRDRGFHLTSMSGPGGGVHLEPTSVMVTSQLDGDEVVALILSVALARANPKMPFAAGAEGALRKIEAALPSRRAAELQTFMERILIGDQSPIPATDLGAIDGDLVATVERAFTDRLRLRFEYTDAKGRASARAVEPHGLLLRPPAWYVVAWDPTAAAARLFRADRMSSPELDESTFIPRPDELLTGVCPDARLALRQAEPSPAFR